MALVAVRPPPVKQESRKFYVVHSEPNKVFALRVSPKARTAIIGFKTWDEAFHMSKMIETHIIHTMEWPDILTEESLFLPKPMNISVLSHVYVQEWDVSDIEEQCAFNYMDFMRVNSTTGSSFTGDIVRYITTDDMYKFHLERLYGM